MYYTFLIHETGRTLILYISVLTVMIATPQSTCAKSACGFLGLYDKVGDPKNQDSLFIVLLN